MFCDKCGAQLADTAGFCNKCGNAVTKRVQQQTQTTYTAPKMAVAGRPAQNKKKGLPGVVIVGLVLVAIVVCVVVAMVVKKSKPTIYGSWSDTNRTITFSFEENGELRVSGPYNILGAELFTFTEDEGTIHLQAKGGLTGMISLDMEYELEEDTMTVEFMGYTMVLHRVEESDATGNVIEDAFEDVMDEIQVYSLYGTWSDSTGVVSFTFNEDGGLRVAGLGDTLGVDVFTFSEVDADTLQLKADTDNPILGAISLNLDYEITGEMMTVSVAGQYFELTKQK